MAGMGPKNDDPFLKTNYLLAFVTSDVGRYRALRLKLVVCHGCCEVNLRENRFFPPTGVESDRGTWGILRMISLETGLQGDSASFIGFARPECGLAVEEKS